MAQLLKFQRAQVLGHLAAGWQPVKVARKMEVACSTITRDKARDVGEEQALRNKPGVGRESKVSLGNVQRIIKLIRRRPFLSAVRIKAILSPHLNHLSTRMIQKTLIKAVYKAHKAALKPLLTQQMMDKRMEFATDYLHWSPHDWAKVMFSDESTFKLVRGTRKTVRRRAGSDRFKASFCVKIVKHPGSVMVWAAFDGFRERASIKFLAKDQTMNTNLYLETMENHMFKRGNTNFLQDGATCHKSKRSMAWFQ